MTAAGVMECTTCEGAGAVWNGRGMGGNDPDSFRVVCADCEGEGFFACETCGNTVRHPGFDCIVCDTLYEMDDISPADRRKLGATFAAQLGVNAQVPE